MGGAALRFAGPVIATAALLVPWTPLGLAGSDPVTVIGNVTASAPDGLSVVTVQVTAWTSVPARSGRRQLARVAREAVGGRAGAPVQTGRYGDVRWAEALDRDRWGLAEWTPPAPVLHRPGTLVVMAGMRLPSPEHLGPATAAVAAAVRRLGPPALSVCVEARTARRRLAPLALGRLLARRLGATVTEAVGGPSLADVFARLPGAAAVAVAGRPINVEVRVTRLHHGLVVDVASPFVTPVGCTATGDGALAA